jgi:hypothetical protein
VLGNYRPRFFSNFLLPITTVLTIPKTLKSTSASATSQKALNILDDTKITICDYDVQL